LVWPRIWIRVWLWIWMVGTGGVPAAPLLLLRGVLPARRISSRIPPPGLSAGESASLHPSGAVPPRRGAGGDTGQYLLAAGEHRPGLPRDPYFDPVRGHTRCRTVDPAGRHFPVGPVGRHARQHAIDPARHPGK